MPQVQLLSREPAPTVPGQAVVGDQVAVTYSTMQVPPRSVLLSLGWYREATDAELAANRRLRFYPKDRSGEIAELGAIGEDLRKVTGNAPPILEVP